MTRVVTPQMPVRRRRSAKVEKADAGVLHADRHHRFVQTDGHANGRPCHCVRGDGFQIVVETENSHAIDIALCDM
jgi:hypothetical protein